MFALGTPMTSSQNVKIRKRLVKTARELYLLKNKIFKFSFKILQVGELSEVSSAFYENQTLTRYRGPKLTKKDLGYDLIINSIKLSMKIFVINIYSKL